MSISNRYSSLARPDLIIIECRFLIHSMQKGIRKLSKSLTAIQRSDQKLWLFRTVIQAWRDQTSSSHSVDSSSTPCQRTFGSKVMAISNRYSSLARPDLIITECRFLIHSMAKDIRKLQLQFDRDPMVGSKVMAISNRYSSAARPDLIITEYRFRIHSM